MISISMTVSVSVSLCESDRLTHSVTTVSEVEDSAVRAGARRRSGTGFRCAGSGECRPATQRQTATRLPQPTAATARESAKSQCLSQRHRRPSCTRSFSVAEPRPRRGRAGRRQAGRARPAGDDVTETDWTSGHSPGRSETEPGPPDPGSAAGEPLCLRAPRRKAK
jgi:hypothetical protein